MAKRLRAFPSWLRSHMAGEARKVGSHAIAWQRSNIESFTVTISNPSAVIAWHSSDPSVIDIVPVAAGKWKLTAVGLGASTIRLVASIGGASYVQEIDVTVTP